MVRELSAPKAWIENSPGIWRTSTDMPEASNVIFENARCGNMRYDLTNLLNPGEWFQGRDGKGPLFVRSPDNPARIWRKVEMVGAGYGI